MYPASPALADGLFTTEEPGNPRVNLLTNKILSVEKTSRSLYFFSFGSVQKDQEKILFQVRKKVKKFSMFSVTIVRRLKKTNF